MSYILDALKKAQAERQLGHAPTIHDMPVHVPAPRRTSNSRAPLLALLGLALLALGGGAFLWWRQAAPPAPVLAQAPAMPAPQVLSEPEPEPVPGPVLVGPPIAEPAPARPVAAPPKPAPVAPKPVPAAAKAAPVAAAPNEAPAPEDTLPTLRELPQALQQGLPQLTFGGYMYSKNPADRLLLIDKVLRHEGEEIAPGLVLEKLLPKAAVMNYRGTRYRMAL